MDPVVAWIVIAVAIVLISPVFLFFPLVKSVSDRIAGKKGNTNELKNLRNRVSTLEMELDHLRTQVLQLGEGQEFSAKMLEMMKSEKESKEKSSDEPGSK